MTQTNLGPKKQKIREKTTCSSKTNTNLSRKGRKDSSNKTVKNSSLSDLDIFNRKKAPFQTKRKLLATEEAAVKQNALKTVPEPSLPLSIAVSRPVIFNSQREELDDTLTPPLLSNKKSKVTGHQEKLLESDLPSCALLSKAAAKWNLAQTELDQDRDRMEREIEQFVKNTLFRRLKFISNSQEMIWSLEKRSICQYSCDQLNIRTDDRFRFWSEWSRRIELSLNRRRSDVNTGIKKDFIGNYCCLVVF
jgi:hypothetical protein